jgi:hypothetical protein
MTEPPTTSHREELDVVIVLALEASHALSALLRRESLLVEAGQYAELDALIREKAVLLLSLMQHTAVLQAAGQDAVLALAKGRDLVESLTRLADAARVDTRVIRGATVAAERVAQIVGEARSGGTRRGYDRSGKTDATLASAVAVNDSI